MSLRGSQALKQKPPRMPREAYYSPPEAVWPLLDVLPHQAYAMEAWECAAGDGLMARTLAAHFAAVTATDIEPAPRLHHPVTKLDFLKSSGPSGQGPLAIITNPPYGVQNRLALRFLDHALTLARRRSGLVALLLPFEFDAAGSRDQLVGAHPAWGCKITCARRLRWRNLPQKKHGPMGHHAWFVWSFNTALAEKLRRQPMRTL